MTNYTYKYNISIPYPSYESCDIVCRSINVDKELKPDVIQRDINVQENNNKYYLVVKFQSNNLHIFRTAISSVLELIALSTQTIATFQINKSAMYNQSSIHNNSNINTANDITNIAQNVHNV